MISATTAFLLFFATFVLHVLGMGLAPRTKALFDPSDMSFLPGFFQFLTQD
ncbi:MAG: hypothetical protein KF858_04875 [Candidatus Sumerlaeia bacterium]|nr:hypothetical protein [Candidatus Sumerlaeia bacterium]